MSAVLLLWVCLRALDIFCQLGVGEFFGELALLEPDSRSSTVRVQFTRRFSVVVTAAAAIISNCMIIVPTPVVSQVTALCECELLVLRRQDFTEIIRNDAEVLLLLLLPPPPLHIVITNNQAGHGQNLKHHRRTQTRQLCGHILLETVRLALAMFSRQKELS
jgi:CRP-like cAMP-binding protein